MEERGQNRMERRFSLEDRRQSLGFEERSQVHCQRLPTSSSEARSHSSVPRTPRTQARSDEREQPVEISIWRCCRSWSPRPANHQPNPSHGG